MSKWNGKIRCLDAKGLARVYTKDKVYEVVNGSIFRDDCTSSPIHESFDEWCRLRGGKWEEVKEIEDLREIIKPCMLVKCRNGEYRIVLQYSDGIILDGFDKQGFIDIHRYNKDLTMCDEDSREFDIIEVYGYSFLTSHILSAWEPQRQLIWKREEKTPQQIKIEEIERKQRELADELAELRKDM